MKNTIVQNILERLIMTKFLCRRLGDECWVETDGDSPADAAQNFSVSLPVSYARHRLFDSENVVEVLFYRIEVGDTEFVTRVFNHGIFRKGGLPRRSNEDKLIRIAKDLGMEPEWLLDSKCWEGEETLEDAKKRIGNERSI